MTEAAIPQLRSRAQLLDALTAALTANSDLGHDQLCDILNASKAVLSEDAEASPGGVDAFIRAVIKLTTKPYASSRRAGAVLLGACAQQVWLPRLLAAAPEWASALLALLAADGAAATQAACLTSLSHLLTRLAEPAATAGPARREAAAIASRCLQALGPHLSGAAAAAAGGGSSTTLAALHLLVACLTCAPSAARASAPGLEAALVAWLRPSQDQEGQTPSQRGAGPLRQSAARCLALLPRAHGDAAAWSSLAARCLVSAHQALDVIGLGLEDAAGGQAAALARRLLAGEAIAGPQSAAAGLLPPPATAGAAGAQPRTLKPHLAQLACLLDVLEGLLTAPAPWPVPLPAASLLLLASRMLCLDDAAMLASGRVPHSATMFQQLGAALPALHAAAWHLVRLLADGVKPALLPLLPGLGRLVRGALRRLAVKGTAAAARRVDAGCRDALYCAAASVLQAGGLASALQLAADVTAAVAVELVGDSLLLAPSAAFAGGADAGGPTQRFKKQRTDSSGGPSAALSLDAAAAAAAAAAAGDGNASAWPSGPAGLAAMAAQRSALALLTALLQAGGAALPPSQRGVLDALVAHMAFSHADGTRQLASEAVTWVDMPGLKALQLCGYQALLASLLAPCGGRPPFLAQALQVFRQGRSDADPAVAAFCAHAALASEALLHPRSLAPAASSREGGFGAGAQSGGVGGAPPLVLPRPRMWSILEASSSNGRSVQAASVAALTPEAVVRGGGVVLQQQNGPPASAAVVAAQHAVGSSVRQAAAPQQLVATALPPVEPVAGPAVSAVHAATAAAHRVATVDAPGGLTMPAGPALTDVAAPGGGQEGHQQQQLLLPRPAVQPARPALSSLAPAAAAWPHSVPAAAPMAGAVPGAEAVPQDTGAVAAAAQHPVVLPSVGDGSSSDSEGSLPDIDSGDSSEFDDDEEMAT